MMNAEQRVRIFQESMMMCQMDPALQTAIREAAAGQEIIWEGDIPDPGPARFDRPAKILLTGKKTIEAAEYWVKADGGRVCALNFASSVHPGGGVTFGSAAQEEDICRVTDLYPLLTLVPEFYGRHVRESQRGRLTRKNTDDCIYTPGVTVLRRDDDEYRILERAERFTLDVITCAAPDQRPDTPEREFKPELAEEQAVFVQRIRMILAVAASRQVDTLILGAFGCGAFGNHPQVVAEAFAQVLPEYTRYFRRVEFAIWCKPGHRENYHVFAETLNIGGDC